MAPQIHAPVTGFNGTVAGVTFADGVGQTDDPARLAYFNRHGYTVDDPPEPDPGPAYPAGPPEKTWRVDQLRAWASEHGVDLTGASKKDEYWALVEATLTPADTPPAGSTGDTTPAGGGGGDPPA